MEELKKAYRKIKKPSWKNVKVAFYAFMAVLFIFAGSLSVYMLRLDTSFDPDKIENIQQTLLIYDSNDELMSSLYSKQNRINISIDDVPKDVQSAFLSAEDSRFYSHNGIDVIRVFGALLSDIKSGSLKEGASTISMQLIKNTHLSNEKAWSRKIEEALLTLKLESTYSKQQILEYYLNTVYFGRGAYGIEAAAQTYFGISAKDLTLAQGALLAGVIKSPAKYAPHLKMANSISRRNLILDLMVKYEYISQSQADEAKNEAVTLNLKDNTALIDHGYFIDTVMLEAAEKLGVDQETLLSSGYRVYTTMDTDLQTTCEELYKDDSLFPKSTSDVKPQSAMVVLDSKTSEIKAIIGGRNYTARFGLNRATQVKRQPGSAIKPILVYAPALESGNYTAASVFNDTRTDFNGYSPKNSGNVYHGIVTLRDSLTYSYNVPAVTLMQKLGVTYCKDFAQKLGITFEESDNSLSIALGGFTKGVTPLELATAYTALANSGTYTKSTTIRKIEDSEGNVVYQSEADKTQVMSEDTAFILTNILQSVIDDGTGKKMALSNVELAGKTGTVSIGEGQGNRDAWMVAYNSDYTAVVWMGYDKTDSTHYLASSVTGGSYPALILKNFFNSIYTDKTAPTFSQPLSVQKVTIDKSVLLKTGIVKIATPYTSSSDTITEYFTSSTVPSEISDNYSPDSPSDLVFSKNDKNQAVLTFTPADKNITYTIYKQLPLSDEKVIVATVSGINKKIMVTDTGTDTTKIAYYYIVPTVKGTDGTEYTGTQSKYYTYDPDKDPSEQDSSQTPSNSPDDSENNTEDSQNNQNTKPTASPSPTKNVSPTGTKSTASPTPTNRPAFLR